MKAFFGIVIHTIRTAVRSRVFHVLLVFLLLSAFVLPQTVQGDGTATGQVQVMLTYSLSLVAVVLSLSSLWLACSMLAREIETYTAHLVLTKPVRRTVLMAGKATGIFLLHALLLVVAAGCVLFQVQWRVSRGDFSEEELREAQQEVLVGRRLRQPPPPDFVAITQQEYQRRLKDGELPEDKTPQEIKSELLRQVKAAYTEIPYGAQRRWVYDNVRLNKDAEMLHVRYRLYIGTASGDEQRQTQGTWAFRVPGTTEPEYSFVRVRAMGGAFQKLALPAEAVSDDGQLELVFMNEDPGQESLIFQVGDRPTLMTRAAGFAGNGARAIVLLLLQLLFLSVLGTVVSALFSTPVAIFAGLSYLVIGMAADMAAQEVDSESAMLMPPSLEQRISRGLVGSVRAVVASPSEFSVAGQLSRGHLVEFRRIASVFLMVVVVQGGVVALAGAWAFNRRELGKVVRR
ncbi:MAG: ABC transporter permease subunit [bacterium]